LEILSRKNISCKNFNIYIYIYIFQKRNYTYQNIKGKRRQFSMLDEQVSKDFKK